MLALGDDDAKRLQQGQKSRYRCLTLVLLGQHKAAQFRPEIPVN